ncbi:uncharacterized protein AAES06_002079 [Glossophaga mutica]
MSAAPGTCCATSLLHGPLPAAPTAPARTPVARNPLATAQSPASSEPSRGLSPPPPVRTPAARPGPSPLSRSWLKSSVLEKKKSLPPYDRSRGNRSKARGPAWGRRVGAQALPYPALDRASKRHDRPPFQKEACSSAAHRGRAAGGRRLSRSASAGSCCSLPAAEQASDRRESE